jgi:hypothetical protein
MAHESGTQRAVRPRREPAAATGGGGAMTQASDTGAPRARVPVALGGAAAGAVGAAAMGLVMLVSRRFGIVGKLAPEHITEAGAEAAGVDRHQQSERAENAASTVAHLAYGAGNGAVFALAAPRLPGPPLVRGLTFAAALLVVSYEGWVPAARILPRLQAQTSGGRWTLVVGHAVYGAALGGLVAGRRTRLTA